MFIEYLVWNNPSRALHVIFLFNTYNQLWGYNIMSILQMSKKGLEESKYLISSQEAEPWPIF